MRYLSSLIIIAIVLLSSCRKDDTDTSPTPMLATDFPATIGSQWVYKRTDSSTHVVDTFTVRILGQTTMNNGQIAKLWEYTYKTGVDTNYYATIGDTVKIFNYLSSNGNYSYNAYIFPFIVGAVHQFVCIPDRVIERKDITVNNILFLMSFHTIKKGGCVNDYFYQDTWFEKRVGIIKQYTHEYGLGAFSNFSIELLSTNIR